MKNAPSVSAQRATVLERLRLCPGPVTIAELSTALGLHANTVREHLEFLVEHGLVRRERGPVNGRGRPPWHYLAVPGTPERDHVLREYVKLAEVLAAQLAEVSTDPQADAVRAGETWGRVLGSDDQVAEDDPAGAAPAGGTGAAPADDALWARNRVVAVLADLGFDPHADPEACEIELRRCPFADAARARSEVICNVHLGIVRGFLATLSAHPHDASVMPFTGDGVCRLTLVPGVPGACATGRSPSPPPSAVEGSAVVPGPSAAGPGGTGRR